jgi:GT2 family glycosyltransferase
MSNPASVGVIIPTFNRGLAVLSTLHRLTHCDPPAAEIWIHIDAADGALERELARQFPSVGVLTSAARLGPGGGRDRCLSACKMPYVFSFDDDSYPVDADIFSRVENIFALTPSAGVIGATIWHRHESPIPRNAILVRVPSFTGCGHAIRLAAYRQVRGYLPRPNAYGLEETDLSLQLFAAGWHIYRSGELRVFHDTELSHHQSAEITSAVVANIGLFTFLNYPMIGWARGVLQLGNAVVFALRMGRFRGIVSGLLRLPFDCYRYRRYRSPIAWSIVRAFLSFRRTGLAP